MTLISQHDAHKPWHRCRVISMTPKLPMDVIKLAEIVRLLVPWQQDTVPNKQWHRCYSSHGRCELAYPRWGRPGSAEPMGETARLLNYSISIPAKSVYFQLPWLENSSPRTQLHPTSKRWLPTAISVSEAGRGDRWWVASHMAVVHIW